MSFEIVKERKRDFENRYLRLKAINKYLFINL